MVLAWLILRLPQREPTILALQGENMTKFQLDVPGLNRTVIGFERLFHEAERRLSSQNYPPHNILKLGEDEYEIELAVAGFKKSELDVRYERGQLTISGKREPRIDVMEYVHQGLGYRSFVKTIALTEYIEIKGAELEDGILRVKLARELPDAQKPKIIDIM